MTQVGTSVDVLIHNPQKSLMPLIGFRVSSRGGCKTITQLWSSSHPDKPILGFPMTVSDATEIVSRSGGIKQCVDIK